ncbi:MAG: D-glycero-alpha-D-manno-heptose-1,7-bisphosphate 7-phosphatase [Fimbriimonadaceae bacterium]
MSQFVQIVRCDHQIKRGNQSFDRVGLFDRDGVLNVDHGYVFEKDRFEWVEGSKDVLLHCRERGYGVGVVTNQSGIGRGYYSERAFLDLMEWVAGEVGIDLVVYCPHAPEADCPGRKPGVRMVQMALDYFGVSGDQAFLIGDKATDLEAASAAGVRAKRFVGGDLREAFKDLGIS